MTSDLRAGKLDLAEQQIRISAQAIALKNTVQANQRVETFDEICAPHPLRSFPKNPRIHQGLPSPNRHEVLAPGQCRFRPCSFWGISVRERNVHQNTCRHR